MAHNVCCDSYRVHSMTCIYYTIILGSSMWRVLFLGAVAHWTWYVHGTNHSTHCEPSGIPNAHSHIVKNFMVLSLAWGWRFKSKHVALTYAFIIWLCWLQYISIKWLYRINAQRDDFVQIDTKLTLLTTRILGVTPRENFLNPQILKVTLRTASRYFRTILKINREHTEEQVNWHKDL